MSYQNPEASIMNIQTETAIVPFQGILQPIRSIDPKIMRYSEGNRFRQNDTASMNDNSDQAGNVYARSGKELKTDPSLGKNIDIYI
jgi:hypothetical protein